MSIAAVVLLINAFVAAQAAWSQTIDSRPIANTPGIVESMWTAARPPHGPYDRIGLRRFAKAGEPDTDRPVFVYLPGCAAGLIRV